MLSNFDDLSSHLQKFLESIPIRDLVECDKLYELVEDVEELIEKHQSNIKGN